MSTTRVSHLSDPRQFATSLNIARRKTDALDLTSDQLKVTIDRDVALTGNFDATGFYSVNGVQVLGAQQAAISNDASGAANQATVNAILAALRAHGIIHS